MWDLISLSLLVTDRPQDQDKLLEPLQFLPPDKKREPDATIRLTHVESLLLLCHTRWGRDYQRSHGVYEIIRATHLAETVDKVEAANLVLSRY